MRLLAAAFCVTALSLAGYLAGSSVSVSDGEASLLRNQSADQAFAPARSTAYRANRRLAYVTSARAARNAGLMKGALAGKKAGADQAAAEQARLAAQAANDQAAQSPRDPSCQTPDEMSHGYCLQKYGGWDGVSGSAPSP